MHMCSCYSACYNLLRSVEFNCAKLGGLIEFHSAKLTLSKGGSVEFDLTKLSKGDQHI